MITAASFHGVHLKVLETGGLVSLETLLSGPKRVVLYAVRRFECQFCHHQGHLLHKAHRVLQDRGVDMYAVGCGSRKAAITFKKTAEFQGYILLDPEQTVYKILGCARLFKDNPIIIGDGSFFGMIVTGGGHVDTLDHHRRPLNYIFRESEHHFTEFCEPDLLFHSLEIKDDKPDNNTMPTSKETQPINY
jgi:hypothetical protein